MRLRRPIAFILSAAVAASALTGCDSFSGHAAAAANSAQVQQLIEFIADLGLERDLRQALQKGGDLRQALLTLLGLESAVNFNVDDLAGARPGQHAVQVWEVTAQSAEDAAALAASQIRAVLEQLKSNGVTEGRIGMVEVDGKYYVVVDVEVTEENTFEPIRPASDDDDNEDTPSVPVKGVKTADGKIFDVSELSGEITAQKVLDIINKGLSDGEKYNASSIIELDLSDCINLQSIGPSAFNGCNNLRSITMGDVNSIGNSAFFDCNLQTVTMGNVDIIEENAFTNCTSLRTVTMGDVDSIGFQAFADCSGLQTVTMGNVDTIEQNAFDGCYDLHTVVMDNVGTIGYGAFSGCSNLTNICFSNSTPPSTGEYAFSRAGSSSGVHIYSNIGETDQATVEGWFDPNVQDKVEFHPYSPGPQNLPTLPSLF